MASVSERLPQAATRAKKGLWCTLIIIALFAVGIFPNIASASYFPSLSTFMRLFVASADAFNTSGYNSQNIPLLTPANNNDPSVEPEGVLAVAGGSALLPDAGPTGTEVDIEEHPRSSQIIPYTVRRGDTLSSIAKMFEVTPNTIVWANDVKNGKVLEGQTLIILPITGVRHTVRKGETVISLAKKYVSDETDIEKYNDLSSSVALVAGQVIIIPNGELATPAKSQTNTKKLSVGVRTTPSKSNPLRGVSGADIDTLVWPVAGGLVTQGLHGFSGVDIGASKGTSIYAAAAGTVIVARGGNAWNGGYGNYIVIAHEGGVQTLYAHANELLVSQGETVSQGEKIATIGRTGEATGFHLHFEVRGAKNPFAK